MKLNIFRGKMFRWSPYPFLRFTPLLMLGIVIANWIDSPLAIPLLVGFFLIYSGLAFFLPVSRFSRFHPWLGGVAMVSLVLFGVIRTHQQDNFRNPDHLLNFTDTVDYYLATVVEYPEPTSNSYRLTLELNRVFGTDDLSGQPLTATVIVYQPKSDSTHLPEIGDRILVKGRPELIEPPKNPAEFDYREYLAQQGIHHQQYLPASRWSLVRSGELPAWRMWPEVGRYHCQNILLNALNDASAEGIALAIVLGLKTHLGAEIRDAYAATGSMHVLAVSGLHVGIIYLILNFLLRPIRRIPKLGLALYVAISILGLGGYAVITGLSPSVLRATVMFSFVVIGTAWKRQTNIYNTLACSAFVLLWYDPYLLYSVGFQLSYLAVFGIVFLQPQIYAWLEPDHRLVDWMWQLTSVSIAAQIATFPLGLYYFHQFPVYFWISNLVVIPGALVMLPLGLLTLLSGFVLPVAAEWFGWWLEQVIHLINTLVLAIQQIPSSTIEGIYISPVQAWLLYAGLLFLILLFYYRRLHFLTAAVTSLLLLIGVQSFRLYQQSRETSMTVYHTREDVHLDFTRGLANIHWGTWDKSAQYHIQPNHQRKGLYTDFVSDTTASSVLSHSSDQDQGVSLIRWQGKTIAIVEKPLSDKKPDQPVVVDYLIVGDNSIRSLDDLVGYMIYDQLIVSSTNSKAVTQALVKQADREHIACHSVFEQGALTIAWKP